jgi:hypothetical protein
MRIEQALEIISDLVFRPGWTITATPAYPLEGGNWQAGAWDKITVTCTIDTVDTNREYAPGYAKPKTITDVQEIDVSRLDEDGLIYVLISKVFADTHQHEDREFLRRRSQGYDAPVHPHKVVGNLRWDIAERHAVQDELADIVAGR